MHIYKRKNILTCILHCIHTYVHTYIHTYMHTHHGEEPAVAEVVEPFEPVFYVVPHFDHLVRQLEAILIDACVGVRGRV